MPFTHIIFIIHLSVCIEVIAHKSVVKPKDHFVLTRSSGHLWSDLNVQQLRRWCQFVLISGLFVHFSYSSFFNGLIVFFCTFGRRYSLEVTFLMIKNRLVCSSTNTPPAETKRSSAMKVLLIVWLLKKMTTELNSKNDNKNRDCLLKAHQHLNTGFKILPFIVSDERQTEPLRQLWSPSYRTFRAYLSSISALAQTNQQIDMIEYVLWLCQ